MRKNILITAIIVAIIGGIIGLCCGTAYRDVKEIKQRAPDFLHKQGYTSFIYEGYQGNPTNGGYVWYVAKDSLGYSYEMALIEWRGEIHIYNLKCLNAVQNITK